MPKTSEDGESSETLRKKSVRPQQIALDEFVMLSESASSAEALVDLFRAAVGAAGISTVAYFQILRNFERLSLERGERIAGPHRRHYVAYKYFDSDPAIARRFASMTPFLWDDLREESLSPALQSLMDDCRREGLEDTITVPVSLRSGDLAAVTLARRGVVFDVGKAAMSKLKLLCLAFHGRYDELLPGEPQRQLSRRELDVMKLAAIGRTNAEIAVELGISVHTVNTLIRRSYVKLGASNRVEASIKLAYIARGGAED